MLLDKAMKFVLSGLSLLIILSCAQSQNRMPYQGKRFISTQICSSCEPQQIRIPYQGKYYYSTEDALAASRKSDEKVYRKIEPLTKPVAGQILMVIPTREYLERTSKETYVGPESMRHSKLAQDTFEFHTEMRDDVKKLFTRIVERRNIFDKVDVVRSDSPDEFVSPRNGYLLWYQDLVSGDYIYMKAGGEEDFTRLPDVADSVSDEFEWYMDRLDLIEAFTHSHSPTT